MNLRSVVQPQLHSRKTVGQSNCKRQRSPGHRVVRPVGVHVVAQAPGQGGAPVDAVRAVEREARSLARALPVWPRGHLLTPHAPAAPGVPGLA